MNGKQDAARRLEATLGKHGFLCYIFRLRVIIKALLKQISLYLLLHFHIRIIVLTCPDNKSARNHQPKSCLPAKSYKSQWCEANVISIEIFAPCQFVPVRVKTREYQHQIFYYDISIAEDLHCLKAVDRNFVWNGGTTRTHSLLCS